MIARAEVLDGAGWLHGDTRRLARRPASLRRVHQGGAVERLLSWSECWRWRAASRSSSRVVRRDVRQGYQGLVQVLALSDDTALVSVQRSSQLILHDLNTGKRKALDRVSPAAAGNPRLTLRNSGREIWASDYDTIVVVDTTTWRTVRSMRLQDAATTNGRQFIGDYAFAADEPQCVVARRSFRRRRRGDRQRRRSGPGARRRWITSRSRSRRFRVGVSSRATGRPGRC